VFCVQHNNTSFGPKQKSATPIQMVFVIKAVFNALLFPRQSYNCDESDRLPEPNKVKPTATLLQNIGFSQNI